MCNFHIGQEVVTLNDSNDMSAQYLKKGEIVTITRLSSCSNCGAVDVNVNNRPTTEFEYEDVLCKCKAPSLHFGFGWSRSENFAPLQTDSEEADMNAAIEEVMNRELFEV